MGGEMGRKTDEEIRAEVERVTQELDLLEREAKGRGEQFVRLDEETLRRKISGDEANSPFFAGYGWGAGTPGGTASVSPLVYNPDPVYYPYHGYLVFGPSGLVQDTDLSLTVVDTRLPLYARNLFVAPNSSMSQTYPVPIPPDFPSGLGGILFSLYMFNLYAPSPPPGTVIDRLIGFIIVS
jgi:hypothetical protein